jgi:hypothetical protein
VETPSILGEIRSFLGGLRAELPELFAPAARPPRPAPERLPDAGEHAALFRARAEFWAAELGVTFGAVRVKDQRTLWGSCSPDGNLNFNWRLTLAPPDTLDYVVIHELAHRVEMNHSRAFWAVVERACPDHRRHRRWLRENGAALYRARRANPPGA